MKCTAEKALAKAALLLMTAAQTVFAQAIAYVLHVDPAHNAAEVSIALHDVPTDLHLAMRIHAEYDAKYWRYLDSLRIEDASAAPASIQREDSTLWRVHLPSGRGVVRYTIHVQPPDPRSRSAWRPYLSAEGALINSPDFFLYVPELAGIASTLELRGVPANWQIATALPSDGAPTRRRADDAVVLLDSPILLGQLREWAFVDRGTTVHVAYLPIPQPTLLRYRRIRRRLATRRRRDSHARLDARREEVGCHHARHVRRISSSDRCGVPPERFEHVADSVCGCNLDAFFERQVRGTRPIDVSPTLGRIALKMAMDTVPAVDDRGNALVDTRLPVSFSLPESPRVVISNTTTAWARAGLRSGDRLIAIAGRTVGSFADLQAGADRCAHDRTE